MLQAIFAIACEKRQIIEKLGFASSATLFVLSKILMLRIRSA
jgi:hypothetical protein